MVKHGTLFALGLVLAGCLPTRVGDGAGYACAKDADCPSPYACVGAVCQTPAGPGSGKSRYVVVATSGVACSPEDPDFAGGQGLSKSCRMKDSATLARDAEPDVALLMGDLQLGVGTADFFSRSFGLFWGAAPLRSVLRPVPGRAEQADPGAAGFFATFPELKSQGEGKGYYSFELGSWHLVGLVSDCAAVGGCGPDSAQGRWLAADLAAHPSSCVLAFMHGSRYGSGATSADAVKPLWAQLFQHHAELVLSGNDALYERFAPLDPDGNRDDTNGIRSFVVGTGGARLGNLTTVAPFSEIVGASVGVLRLELSPGTYRWSFSGVADQPVSDSGSAPCHPRP